MVELVDDAAHADVGTILQRPGQHQRAVAASRPVVVLHVASVHVPHAASRLDHVGRIDVAVVEGRHDGGRLEYRSRLQQVAHRMVGDLPVLSVVAVLHVDHGLDVSRGHLHDDRHADLSADQFQLVHDGPLRQVLHVDVDRGHYVRSVLRRHVGDGQKLAAHHHAVANALLASQHGVEGHFEPTSRHASAILLLVEIADGASCQRPKRMLPVGELVGVDSAFVCAPAEDGQLRDLHPRVVIDALLPHRPYAAPLGISLFQFGLELLCRLLGEDLVEPLADGVEAIGKRRVRRVGPQRLEVHEYLVLRHRGGHQPPVATQYVASRGLQLHAVASRLLGRLGPVVLFCCHDVEGFSQHTT